MGVTDHDALRRRRRELQARADDLAAELERSAPGSQEATPAAVAALQRGLMEIRIAEEELRAQSEELTQAYEQLVTERERYRQLFEHAPVGYVVTDHLGRIVDGNHMAARLFDAARHHLIDSLFVAQVALADRRHARDVLRLVASGGRASAQLRLSAAGHVVHATALAATLGDDGDATVRWVLVPLVQASTDDPRPGPALEAHAGPRIVQGPVAVVVLPQRGPAADRLQRLTAASDGMVAVLDAPGREDPVETVLETSAEVVVVDLTSTRARSWIEVLRAAFPDRPLVALAPTDSDEPEIREAVADGADVVTHLDRDDEALAAALHAAAGGLRVVPEAVMATTRAHLRDARLVAGLDEDERWLLRRIAAGATTAGIAQELHVSPRTAKRRVRALMRRLGVASRRELAVVAARGGIDRDETDAGH